MKSFYIVPTLSTSPSRENLVSNERNTMANRRVDGRRRINPIRASEKFCLRAWNSISREKSWIKIGDGELNFRSIVSAIAEIKPFDLRVEEIGEYSQFLN